MKKLIKSICFSFLAFMFALGSIFLPIGKSSQKYASAVDDTTYNYSFQSSGFYGVLNHYEYSGSVDRQELCFFSNSFSYDSSYNRILLSPSFIATFGLDNPLAFSSPYTYFNDFYHSTVYQNVIPLDTPNYDYAIFVGQSSYNASNVVACYHMRLYYTSGFNCNVYKVDIFIDTFSSTSDMLVFKYYDINDKYLQISYMVPKGYDFGFRTYYFTNPTALTDNQYYNQGYNTGKSEGISIGENQGYNSGYSTGYDDGFETGKLEGVIESNNYSFFGLISAIIDAPVKILTSLFNFNFLGVNLWAFFTSILTISLVIFVIRKFMAKG